jgi:hypothetical protein
MSVVSLESEADMPTVQSSVIDEIDWHNRELTVRFTTGRVYVYSHVPQFVYFQFLGAASKGEYFNHEIRDHYRFRELTLTK